jgi:RsiW-degrading membrane proteinase PrsW (M82 family)
MEPDPTQTVVRRSFKGHSDRLVSDLKALRSHLLLPIEEIRSLRWLEDKKLIGILLLGLFPIVANTLFASSPQTIYWCLGFYFSVLWALFFYRFFSPVGATKTNAVICFLGTGLISMALLLAALGLGLQSFRTPLLASSDVLVRLPAFIFTVGVPEEICKALVILYLLRTGPKLISLPTMVFYGLMSGLGFGIYEGMNYQMGENFSVMNNAPNLQSGMANYYFDNMLRLTTLPFLHAMWTAIGAYFWSLSFLYRSRRRGLWAAALGIPAILHGAYDTFTDSSPWLSLGLAALSVFALMIYLSRSQEFERALQKESGVVTEGVRIRRS